MNATSPAGPRPAPIVPSGLTVLYDADCPVCRRARRWVERHRQLVPVQFVPAASDLAMRRFPGLDVGSTLVDVTVIADTGAVLRGDRAWITVLWAVARTRSLAFDLANGRRTRMFRRFKGATEAVRRLAGTTDSSALPAPRVGPWPAPDADSTCPGCRT
jgi:predicted DCC family thiol-disulfide oxidoreductase YuxK